MLLEETKELAEAGDVYNEEEEELTATAQDQPMALSMRKDVQNYVAGCDVCNRNKYQALSPAGLLQQLPIPKHILEEISMDFITRLPKSNMYDVILVIVDCLSKYTHFIPLSHHFTAKEVAEKFVKEMVRLHGFPKSIVSDRDKIFKSHF